MKTIRNGSMFERRRHVIAKRENINLGESAASAADGQATPLHRKAKFNVDHKQLKEGCQELSKGIIPSAKKHFSAEKQRWIAENTEEYERDFERCERMLTYECGVFDGYSMTRMHTECPRVVEWLTDMAKQLSELDNLYSQNGRLESFSLDEANAMAVPDIMSKDGLERCLRFAEKLLKRNCLRTQEHLDELKGVCLPPWYPRHDERERKNLTRILGRQGKYRKNMLEFITSDEEPLRTDQIRHSLGSYDAMFFWDDFQVQSRVEKQHAHYLKIAHYIRPSKAAPNNSQTNPLQEFIGSWRCVSIELPIGTRTFAAELAQEASKYNDDTMIPSYLVINMDSAETHLEVRQIFFKIESSSPVFLDLSRTSTRPNGVRLREIYPEFLYDGDIWGFSREDDRLVVDYYSDFDESRLGTDYFTRHMTLPADE